MREGGCAVPCLQPRRQQQRGKGGEAGNAGQPGRTAEAQQLGGQAGWGRGVKPNKKMAGHTAPDPPRASSAAARGPSPRPGRRPPRPPRAARSRAAQPPRRTATAGAANARRRRRGTRPRARAAAACARVDVRARGGAARRGGARLQGPAFPPPQLTDRRPGCRAACTDGRPVDAAAQLACLQRSVVAGRGRC